MACRRSAVRSRLAPPSALSISRQPIAVVRRGPDRLDRAQGGLIPDGGRVCAYAWLARRRHRQDAGCTPPWTRDRRVRCGTAWRPPPRVGPSAISRSQRWHSARTPRSPNAAGHGRARPACAKAGQGGAACGLRRLRPVHHLAATRGVSASRSVQPGRRRCRGCGFMCCCTRLAWPPASIARATDGITQIAADSTAADRADLVVDSRPIVRMAGSIERHAAPWSRWKDRRARCQRDLASRRGPMHRLQCWKETRKAASLIGPPETHALEMPVCTGAPQRDCPRIPPAVRRSRPVHVSQPKLKS